VLKAGTLVILFFGLGSILFAEGRTTSFSCPEISPPLTFQKLADTIRVCRISNIDDLLPLLPAQFRSRYVLVYASRSLQGATPEFPRVILFGFDAKFIIAFAGHPDLAGYDSMETIEFDDPSKRFLFREIQFPSDDIKGKQTGLQPIFSETNPRLCKNCHRQDLRPNWDNYPGWPGVFGSKDDVMPDREKQSYESFMAQKFQKQGRYRFLENAQNYPDDSPYIDYYGWKRPNLQLSSLLSGLNSQANARALGENPKLKPFRYAMLAAITCHVDFHDPKAIAELLPPEITATFHTGYEQTEEKVKKEIELSYFSREERQQQVISLLPGKAPIEKWQYTFSRKEAGFTGSINRLRYLMEGAGVPFTGLTLEFGTAESIFEMGPGLNVGGLDSFLWRELLDPVSDQTIYAAYLAASKNRDIWGDPAYSDKADLCRNLQQKSLEALASPKTALSSLR
jgi:hypothetical protein